MKGFGLQPDDVFRRAAGKPALHGKNRRTFFVLRVRDAPGFPGILGGEGGGAKLLPPHVGGQKGSPGAVFKFEFCHLVSDKARGRGGRRKTEMVPVISWQAYISDMFNYPCRVAGRRRPNVGRGRFFDMLRLRHEAQSARLWVWDGHALMRR